MTEAQPLSPAKRALLARALERRREAASARTIPRRASAAPAPLSFAQQRMWFLEQLQPGAPTFNGARALRLRGQLDRGALERALRAVIGRHESLRTVVVPYAEAGRTPGADAGRTLDTETGRALAAEPVQGLLDAGSFALAIEPGPPPRSEQELDERLRELSRRPFDLTGDLMLRATLVALGPEEHVLLLNMHHIAADAHSDGILFSELSELYDAARSGRAPEVPPLPIQYADYAVWQRERLQGEALRALRSHWARALAGAPELLRLPTDRPRPAVQRHEGSHHRFTLDRQLADALLEIGRPQGATFFMTALAAFATLLARLTGEQDIVIGSPIANRNEVELQGLIGFFTNTIALRIRLDGNPSFRDVVGRARAAALDAYAHQELPFEQVVEAVAPRRDPSRNPLFQVNFRAQAHPRPAPALSGLQVEPLPVDIGFSRFDLALELEVAGPALRGFFEFDRDLFDAASITGFEERLRELLARVVEDPDVPLLALLPGSRRPAGHSIRRRSQR